MDVALASGTRLARAIREREVSARAVVDEHIAILERAHERVNAVVCPRYEEARAEAGAADARIAAGGEDLPPFLGVPCTIKESIAVAGMPNCAGLVARRDHRAERTAPAAQRLLDTGAICLGLTNTSELTMWIESENRVYGRTNSAYDERRSAGGSSGGEGAAIGCGGSVFGLGTDLAGSIRVPAFFNGVFGHKPTPGIVPLTGHFPCVEGETRRLVSYGPLARRAEDLWPLLTAIAGADGEDDSARDVALGDPADVSLDGLPVLIAEHASLVPVSRELREARDRAALALERAGARVQRRPMKSLRRGLELFLAALGAETAVSLRQLLLDEGAEPLRLRGAFRRDAPHTIPTVLTVLTEGLPRRIPERRTRAAVDAGRRLGEEVQEAIGDGVLLHPPHARVAPRHGRTVGRPWTLTPTAVFNLLGLPATQVPLGIGPGGLPLGVQVAACRDQDRRCVAAALELERAFGGWVPPVR